MCQCHSTTVELVYDRMDSGKRRAVAQHTSDGYRRQQGMATFPPAAHSIYQLAQSAVGFVFQEMLSCDRVWLLCGDGLMQCANRRWSSMWRNTTRRQQRWYNQRIASADCVASVLCVVIVTTCNVDGTLDEYRAGTSCLIVSVWCFCMVLQTIPSHCCYYCYSHSDELTRSGAAL